jgi:hypothetical protein
MEYRRTWDLDWNERPSEEARNLNPAFCGELIFRAVSDYRKLKPQPFSFALSFLILPIALHKATRDRLPGKASTAFVGWLADNGPFLAQLPDRVLRLVPVICPLCDSHLAIAVPSVTQIKQSLSGIETQLASVRRDSPRLQGRLSSLEVRRTEIEEQLRTAQRDLAARIQDNERLRIQQNDFTEQARVSGRIAYYLENVKAAESDSRIPQAIERLRAEIAELEQALDDDTLQGRLDTALSLVNRDLTAYAGDLGLEHGNNPLRLDMKNLTVVADTVDGPLALSQMGSGENWVGYHVATHISLHKLFRLRKRPVPAILMFDQPSQAHYPPERDENGRVNGLADEDQAVVQRLFKLLSVCSAQSHSEMQIIVADHVELLEQWFRDAIVERWRDGIKLVPQTWLKS